MISPSCLCVRACVRAVGVSFQFLELMTFFMNIMKLGVGRNFLILDY